MPRRAAVKLLGSALLLAGAPAPTQAAAAKSIWKVAVGLNGFQSGTRKYKKNYPIWEVPDPYDACLKGKRAIDAVGSS